MGKLVQADPDQQGLERRQMTPSHPQSKAHKRATSQGPGEQMEIQLGPFLGVVPSALWGVKGHLETPTETRARQLHTRSK